MGFINHEKFEEISEKVDDLFSKENISMFERRFLLEDMLKMEKWVEQEERSDKLINELKKMKGGKN